MAGQAGKPSFDLSADLLENGPRFSFFQVVRLLRVLTRGEPVAHGTESVRIRPQLSLAFPAADVAAVARDRAGSPGFDVTATFLGLYGTASPLPTFYTEDLLSEAAEDASVSRDFVDIINEHLYHLLFSCWGKYRLPLRLLEENDTSDRERLFCFLGLWEKELRRDVPEEYSLLRYAGLFNQFPRSALALETMLRDALGLHDLEIIPCLPRRVAIPSDQRIALGSSCSSLGEETILGEEMEDRCGRFRIRIGPVSGSLLQTLLPGCPAHQKITALTRLYLTEPLEYDIELVIIPGEVKTASLGSPSWSRLGLDTWMFSGEQIGEVTVAFPPER